MIDRKLALITIATTALTTAITANYALWLHPLPPVPATAAISAPALMTVFMWLFIRLVVHFSYDRKAPLDPAYGAYFGRALLLYAVFMMLVFGYICLIVPLTGGKMMDMMTYNRLVMIASGLIFAVLGNVVPKLPYQPFCRWLEIGPERTYRVNRFGGWLMVLIGGAEIALGLVFPLTDTQFFAAATTGLTVLLVPYFWIYYRHRRAYVREGGGAI
jgi:hypothetical protein